MKTLAWVLQVLLAVAFAAAGSAKLMTTRAELASNPQMAWTEDFSQTQIRMIGVAEVLGAAGLILPAATGILPVLTPVAAGGLAVLMGGAVVTHLQRGEPVYAPLVLAVLCVAVLVLRLRMGAARGSRSGPARR